MATDQTPLLAQMIAAAESARTLTATFHTQEDWQRFYDREGGPLRFAQHMFPDAEQSVRTIFVGEFLLHLRAAQVDIYVRS